MAKEQEGLEGQREAVLAKLREAGEDPDYQKLIFEEAVCGGPIIVGYAERIGMSAEEISEDPKLAGQKIQEVLKGPVTRALEECKSLGITLEERRAYFAKKKDNIDG